MRQNDGFHLSVPGAERLGRYVFAELQKELDARASKN
jgi:lysophospholipase L1-like esterase